MRSFWISALASVLMVFAAPAASHAQGGSAPASAETENFVRGFVRFLAYHEAGHLLMTQIADLNNNPDWSQSDREDYADKFAMILLRPDANDPDGLEEIVNAAAGWLQVDDSIIRNEPHAPASQRASDILCLLYGSDPEAFADLRDLTDPSMDCVGIYQAMEREIREVFQDYSGEMGQEINIVYARPTLGMKAAHDFLRASGVVEDLKDDIEFDFYLTNKTTIQAISCDGRVKSDSFYFDRVRAASPEDDHFVITLCYEMIDARLKYGMKGFEDQAQ